MLLRRGQPTFIKISDVSLEAARRGVLQLHLKDLPEGSSVLYSRSWPFPESLMDFGHATVVDELVAGGKHSVWQSASLNTRFFAVIPSRAAKSVAFFRVSPMTGGSALLSGRWQSDQESGFWLQGTTAAIAAAFALGMVGVLIWKWHACQVEVPIQYINIHGNTRPICETAADMEQAESAETGKFLSALQSIRDEIKEKADFGLAAWSSRLASVSTRAGTTRRSFDSDDDVDVEEHHSDEREELMQPIREDDDSHMGSARPSDEFR